ncbi:hypothetical protein [Neobacillus niacini]|uniref:hypothetical protein n=1 Tax=Neobacillus niacini TaxID=86668 RepID=UPI0021CAFD2D|nr:hypothetical protein [Neobacillus niacini]MCM3765190.1 hypothetical protein [Neobacillus niacini]
MQVQILKVLISTIVVFSIVSLLSGHLQWGIFAGLVVGVGSAKWFRLKRQEANDEIEYDERINANIKEYSFHTFSISNLLLLVYLIASDLILNEHLVKASYLVIYVSITFIVAFYIVPLLARRG